MKEIDRKKIRNLRLARQFLVKKAGSEAYLALYRDLQPGQNVYWNGFGQPPTLSFRSAFDDLTFNAERQRTRALVKGRFVGGNLGWIVREDLELFAALYRKPLDEPTETQLRLLAAIEREPQTIQTLKEETGLLVKEITPALHRLQEAFLVYEDQYDGRWDRGWYRFGEMFPVVDLGRYSRCEALQILLRRFAYRFVWFDAAMARSFYRLPAKEIAAALAALCAAGELLAWDGGDLLTADAAVLEGDVPETERFVCAIHRNDPLYRAEEPRLKALAAKACAGLTYDCDPLQYLLVDGEFAGAAVGHFRNGPYDLNDVVLFDSTDTDRREEILSAVAAVNSGKLPQRFCGEAI